MVQVVRLVKSEDRATERDHILNMPGVDHDHRHVRNLNISGRRGDGANFIWERHSEASTATIVLPRTNDDPFQPDAAPHE